MNRKGPVCRMTRKGLVCWLFEAKKNSLKYNLYRIQTHNLIDRNQMLIPLSYQHLYSYGSHYVHY